MVIDFSSIVTQILVWGIPVVLTSVVSLLVNEWKNLLKSQKFGHVIQVIQQLASTFISAAAQIAEEAGWTGQQCHDFVFSELKAAIGGLPIKFTDDEINKIIDGILEGTYAQMKKQGVVAPPAPVAVVGTPPEAIFSPPTTGGYGTPAEVATSEVTDSEAASTPE